MHSLTRKYMGSINYSAREIRSIRLLGEFKGRQELFARQSPDSLDTLRRVAQVESTESSNRIEGIIAEKGRVADLVFNKTRPRDRSEQEIAGYRDALANVHASWRAMEPSADLVLELHKTMMRHTGEKGGTWKTRDNAIVTIFPDGSRRLKFSPVSAEKTPKAMETLFERYTEAVDESDEPLFVIPMAILDFLCVHPFRDGNGRVSRLLTLLMLYKAGYIVGKYISLERIVEESRETYYETLAASSTGWHQGIHDPKPWMNYFWGTLTKAYAEFEERVGTVSTGRGSKSEQIVLAVKRHRGPFSISDIEGQCQGISRDMVRHVLRRLRDDGEIESTGVGRGAKWTKTPGKL
jgi:Fic family protein